MICMIIFAIPYMDGPMAIGALCLVSFFVGVVFPIQKQWLHDYIHEGSSRATILSFESIIDRLLSAFAVWPMGWMMAEGNLNPLLQIIGIGIGLFMTLGYLFAVRSKI